MKKHLLEWAILNRAFLLNSKFEYNKLRRQEGHTSQLAQMNKALTQILNKQAELEKNIAAVATREKLLKDAISNLNQISQEDTKEILTKTSKLKELERENQILRDKLEAVESNVSGFIQEMSQLLENEEHISAPSDDDGLGDSQVRSPRKKKINLLR